LEALAERRAEEKPMRLFIVGLMLVCTLGRVGAADADEVIFLNGDRLTGKIVSAAGGKLVLKTDAAGEVTIDLAKVKTFSSDEPIDVRVGDKKIPHDGQIEAEMTPGTPPAPLAIKDIIAINPPPPAWHGSFALNGLFTTGNSETEQIGFLFRLHKKWDEDRLLFGAEYSYGRQTDPNTGVSSTTVDFGQASAKYERDLTEKFYAYGLLRFERDGVAKLDYRFTPSAGVGYRWFEGPSFNFSTEAGLAYTYEEYSTTGSNSFWGPRFAYSVDWRPVEPLRLYNTFEYLPSFRAFTEDYLVNINAGLRATVWKGLFTDVRIEYRYDNEPAPGRKKADTRYILGLGWEW
jgi:putative salt-induced outer membrane protein YdiY